MSTVIKDQFTHVEIDILEIVICNHFFLTLVQMMNEVHVTTTPEQIKNVNTQNDGHTKTKDKLMLKLLTRFYLLISLYLIMPNACP